MIEASRWSLRLTVVDLKDVDVVFLQIVIDATIESENSIQGVHLVPYNEVL